jgi:hypothetical protein
MFNVEEDLIKFLTEQGYTVFADVPYERPQEFLTVERTGGSDINVALDNPTIAIQCWSTSRYNASEMALGVIETMEKYRGWSEKVTKCRQNTMYNFPDEKQARYQIIYDITTYKK